MKLKNEAPERELAPEGSHNAVCIQILDYGTQLDENYGTKQRKCSVAFQLVDEKTEEGEPFVVYKKYNLPGLGPKANLAKDLKSWQGLVVEKDEEIDLDEVILGKSCVVTIVYNESEKNGKTYDNVATITNPVKVKGKTPVFKATEPVWSLWLNEEQWDQTIFDAQQDWIKDIIKKSDEYKDLMAHLGSRRQPKQSAKVDKKKK